MNGKPCKQHMKQSICRHQTPPAPGVENTPYGPLWPKVTPSTNRKYITDRNTVRGGPIHGHAEHAQKVGEDRSSGSRDMLADRHTHTHRDRQTDRNYTPLPYRSEVNIESGLDWMPWRREHSTCGDQSFSSNLLFLIFLRFFIHFSATDVVLIISVIIAEHCTKWQRKNQPVSTLNRKGVCRPILYFVRNVIKRRPILATESHQ